MALLINDLCIACDVCLAPCPNKAITAGEEIYTIDPDKCTECVGHHAVSRLVATHGHLRTRFWHLPRVSAGKSGPGVVASGPGRLHMH